MESYELYCLADRRFYDTPANRGAEHPDFTLVFATGPGRLESRPRRDVDALRAGRPGAAGPGLEDPRLVRPRGRRAHARRGVGLLRSPRHRVQVPPQRTRPGDGQLEVRPARFERQAGDDLPDRRGPAGARAQGARRPPPGHPRAVHPQRPPVRRGPALRPVRRLRQPVLPERQRRARPGSRGRQGPAGPGPPRADVLHPGVGESAVLPRVTPGSAQLGHHQRPRVHDRRRHPVLQRRRGLPRPPQRDRCEGRAEGRPPAGRSRHERPRRGRPGRARAGHPAAARRTRRGPEGARLLRAGRAPLPGPGVRRREPAAARTGPALPADPPGRDRGRAGRVRRVGRADGRRRHRARSSNSTAAASSSAICIRTTSSSATGTGWS